MSVPTHVIAIIVQSRCSRKFTKPVLRPAQTHLRHRPELFTRALTCRTSSDIHGQDMVERWMRLSSITALHKVQQILLAFFWIGSHGVLECIIEGGGVTARD